MTDDKLQQWEESLSPETTPITLEQMDALLKKYSEDRAAYEAKKKEASDLYKVVEASEKMLMNALRTANRGKYEVEGVGMAYIVEKEAYTVPKSNEDKTLLFNYIKDKYGPEVLMTMVGINFQTLNSWANQEVESGVMQIPGLAQPTMQESLSFRKKA